MKLGIVADIHSNILALRECLKYMEEQECEEYIFLGDFVSDTAHPLETMDLIYQWMEKYPCHLLRGNREEYMLEQRAVQQKKKEGPLWINNSASGNLLYTLENLREKDLEFFETLPITFVYRKEGLPPITFCHGSPENTRELLQLGGDNTKAWLQKIPTEYFVAAHTHHPGQFESRGRRYMNPGSLGIAIGTPGLAQCMLLESRERDRRMCWEPVFLTIPYDVNWVVAEIFRSGLYERAKWFLNANLHIFLTGIDRCAELVALAKEKNQKKSQNEVFWPYIEEECFMQAAKELEIPDYAYLEQEFVREK